MKRAGVLVIACLWLVCSRAYGQGIGWTVWLYNAADGQMTQINESGSLLSGFTLPAPAGFDRYPTRVAVGHGGSPFAYVVSNSTTNQGILVVSDQNQIKATFPLPPTFSDSTEFIADSSLFNEDNTLVTLGYSLENNGWELISLNVTTNQVDYTVRYDLPAIAVLGLPGDLGITPVVRRFIGRTATFNLVDAGVGNPVTPASYDWNIDTNTLTANPVFTSLDTDSLAGTGEIILSLADQRLPNAFNAFALGQSNSLQVYDPNTGARYPFLNLPDASLSSPRFIQNGELILADTVDTADRYAWTVFQRDGSVVGTIPTAATINDVRGLPDGFVYTTDQFSPGTTTVVYVNTRDGLDAGVPIWSGPPGATPMIVWAGGDTITAQVAYTPWAQLAEPVYAPGSTPFVAPAPDQPLLISPAQAAPGEGTPVFSTFLAVGGLARVNTTDGDQLNVRAGPGVNYQITAKLGDDAQVTLMEGPINADGFTWWKIRTGSGIVGWCVESVADGGTRLQTLVPA